MPAALPVLCFVAMLVLIREFPGFGWRASFLLAAVFWGVLVTAITELLSIWGWLAFWPVLAAWGISSVILLAILASRGRDQLPLQQGLPRIVVSRVELVFLASMILIVGAVGAIALAAPPNTWDSMTYHMSRVMHWIQDKSVAFYPTSNTRQLYLNPWGEFAILQFQILAGGDGLANLVQWFSMLGSLVGVSLLAKQLKAGIRGQIYSAVVCVTLPMGILQGSSTQTDYVVSFWLVCFIYFGLLFRTKASLLHSLAAGGALGLAILTKATAYFYAFPFLLWIALPSLHPPRARQMLFLGLALAAAALINLGHAARNYDLSGSPLGPPKVEPNYVYANEEYSLPALVSNVVRNLALQVGTPSNNINATFANGISFIHSIIGISPDDPRTTWLGTHFQVFPLSLDENLAGNPIHLALVAASLVLYAFHPRKKEDAGIYMLCVIMAFVLFCLALKWQPWNGRLHLPLFVLSAPFAGLVFSRIRQTNVANLCMALLLIAAIPWALENSNRRVLGSNSVLTTSRISQYFAARRSLAGPYAEAAAMLSTLHCSNLGLVLGSDDWEYPLWVLLRQGSNPPVHIEDLNVTNASRKYYDNYPSHANICAILVVTAAPPGSSSTSDSVDSPLWSSGPVAIYTRASIP